MITYCFFYLPIEIYTGIHYDMNIGIKRKRPRVIRLGRQNMKKYKERKNEYVPGKENPKKSQKSSKFHAGSSNGS